MISFTPHTPSLSRPLGNKFTLGLEKKKADPSSTLKKNAQFKISHYLLHTYLLLIT